MISNVGGGTQWEVFGSWEQVPHKWLGVLPTVMISYEIWLLRRVWDLLPLSCFLSCHDTPAIPWPSTMTVSLLMSSLEADTGYHAYCTACRAMSQMSEITQSEVILPSNAKQTNTKASQFERKK